MVFLMTSWVADKDTDTAKLYDTIKECMIEVIELVTTNPLSAM